MAANNNFNEINIELMSIKESVKRKTLHNQILGGEKNVLAKWCLSMWYLSLSISKSLMAWCCGWLPVGCSCKGAWSVF